MQLSYRTGKNLLQENRLSVDLDWGVIFTGLDITDRKRAEEDRFKLDWKTWARYCMNPQYE